MTLSGDQPGVQEAYLGATQSTDLSFDPERRTAATDLIAAGLNPSRLGGAITRMRAEWDAARRPRRLPADGIEGMHSQAMRMEAARRERGRLPPMTREELSAARAQAHDLANDWYNSEVCAVLASMRSVEAVRYELAQRLERAHPGPDATAVVADVLRAWLDNRCHHCEGRGYALVPGTSRKSNRRCESCHGSGERPIPHGIHGAFVLREIACALSRWRTAQQKTTTAIQGRHP